MFIVIAVVFLAVVGGSFFYAQMVMKAARNKSPEQIEKEARDYEAQVEQDRLGTRGLSVDPRTFLEKYERTPRVEDEFLKKISKDNNGKLLSRKADPEIQASLLNAPLAFARIVQANQKLYNSGNDEFGGVLYVFSTSEQNRTNLTYLHEVVERIRALRNSEPTSAALRKVKAEVEDEASLPDRLLLPKELAPDGETYLEAKSFMPESLPGGKATAGFIPGFHGTSGGKPKFLAGSD